MAIVLLVPVASMAANEVDVDLNVSMEIQPPAPQFALSKSSITIPPWMWNATSSWDTFGTAPTPVESQKFTITAGYLGSGQQMAEVTILNGDANWTAWAPGNVALFFDGANVHPNFKQAPDGNTGIGAGGFRVLEAVSPWGPMTQSFSFKVRRLHLLPSSAIGTVQGTMRFHAWTQ
jgi:hypothetical protein